MTTTTLTHYELLGVDRDATPDDVRKAFRGLSRSYHPDQNHSEAAGVMYRRLTEAMEVLCDPAQRADYDRGLDRPEPAPTPEPAPAPEPVWEGEETVDLDDEYPADPADPADDVDLDFDINVVDDTTTATDGDGDSSRWSRRSSASEDAVPSTAAQRRTWWRLTIATFLALSAVWWYAAVASQTVRVPTGVADWTTMTVGLGFFWTAGAIYAILVRPFRRLVLALLAVSTLIGLYLGWGAWELGQGHTYLPLSPGGAAGLALLLAVVGRRTLLMHKGRHLTVEEEAAGE